MFSRRKGAFFIYFPSEVQMITVCIPTRTFSVTNGLAISTYTASPVPLVLVFIFLLGESRSPCLVRNRRVVFELLPPCMIRKAILVFSYLD